MVEHRLITVIPPALSLLTGISLAVLSLYRGRKNPENFLFSLVCIWASMLAPVFLLQHIITEEESLLRIDRSIHFFYVYLPPIFLAFLHRMIGLKRPLMIGGAFLLSFVISLMTQSNAYIAGMNRYEWGTIAKGGPVFTVFGAYCGLVLLYAIQSLASDLKQETNPIARLKKKYVLISFIVTGALTLGNMPSISGVDLYPTGNFMFLPLAVMAYGVLRYRLMDIPEFFLSILFWISISLFILLPNVLLFLAVFPAVRYADPWAIFLLLMLWFPVNVYFVKRLQAALEPVFHRNRAGLKNAESGFLGNILLLRNRADLIREFAQILEETLNIQGLRFYEKGEEVNVYLGPNGERLTLAPDLKDWFLSRRSPVQRSLVEANPGGFRVREHLMECFRETESRYILPLAGNDGLIGLFFLGSRSDGREIRPDEARFLENITPMLAVAISNAILYQRVSNLKDTLEQRSLELSREIIRKKEAEEERRKSDEKYRLVAEKVSDVIWVVDPETSMFTFVTPSVERLLGYSSEEMTDVPLMRIMTPESLEKVLSLISRELKNEKDADRDLDRSWTFELDLIAKNGIVFPSEVTASFFRDPSGRVVGILGVARDIRERRRLEIQLRTARKMEAIGTLAGGVAHDLNNILSGITSYPELLLMDLPSDSPLKSPLRTIKKSGEKAAAIVQDLLTLSRRVAAEKEVVNLNDVVTEYLYSPEFDLLKTYHPDMEVTSDLDPRLANVKASRIHLVKVVMNLISNAAEAMPDGGRIRICTENEERDRGFRVSEGDVNGRRVILKVSDTGHGIAAEDLERIFEPFYTKKKMGRSGTGLGMAVVWGTVQDHDGAIEVDSRLNVGTTFTIRLPGVDGKPKADRPHAALEDLTGNGETILVVDDVPEQREIASKILDKLGYHVKTAGGGEEALEILRAERVDLLLLDMIMDPGMDGLTTYRRILEIHPGQRAIVVSGFSETDRTREVLKLGAGAYVKKPYTLESIGQAVKGELK